MNDISQHKNAKIYLFIYDTYLNYIYKIERTLTEWNRKWTGGTRSLNGFTEVRDHEKATDLDNKGFHAIHIFCMPTLTFTKYAELIHQRSKSFVREM